MEEMVMSKSIVRWVAAVAVILLAVSAPTMQARDRGINQPGAAGNHPTAGGAAVAGSARQTRAVGAPGPGAPGPGTAGAPGAGPGAPGPGTAGAPWSRPRSQSTRGGRQ